jgi:hypothetical protein
MSPAAEHFPWEFPMHVAFYPSTIQTGSSARSSASRKDATWRGDARTIALRLVCEPRKYRASDRVAYWSYVRLALAAGVSPLSAEQWLMLCGVPDVPREWRGETDEERRPTQKERERMELFADIATLGGFQITSIRPGGSFGGVRRETGASTEGGHLLTLKTCKKCLELLPAFCFAKQLKGRRSACKWCDNARRRAAKA